MKFIPILFSAAMVQALQAGTKTQTRRVVKLKHIDNPGAIHPDGTGLGWVAWSSDKVSAGKTANAYPDGGFKCPYGAPGDILWVRETFYAYGWWKKEGLKMRFVDFTVVDMDGKYHYQDNRPSEIILKRKAYEMGWHKRSAIFMPRDACRLFLKRENTRVERLQEISEADAISEGLTSVSKDGKTFKYGIPDSDGLPGTCDSGWAWSDWEQKAVNAYKSLWDKINGAESWEANPWVWVVEFDSVDKPDNF
jgi:hypothetical protein